MSFNMEHLAELADVICDFQAASDISDEEMICALFALGLTSVAIQDQGTNPGKILELQSESNKGNKLTLTISRSATASKDVPLSNNVYKIH